jgi:hypothetical protein
VPVALPGAHEAVVGDDRLLEDELARPAHPVVLAAPPWRVTRPRRCRRRAYRHGIPPSATWVPTPVIVKNAGMPLPPGAHPLGQGALRGELDLELTVRYCLANSLFSPT